MNKNKKVKKQIEAKSKLELNTRMFINILLISLLLLGSIYTFVMANAIDVENKELLISYNAETDVKADLIAPGTKGSFEFSLQNLSEVNATYSVTFSSELVGGTGYLPIVFTLKDGEGNVMASDTQLSAFNTELVEVAANMGDAAATYTVEWEWVYEGNNGADTALGEAAQAGNVKYNVAMRIVMTQVD